MRSLTFLLLSITGFINSYALTSDTIHVKHYDIYIDSIDYPAKSIQGSCMVTIQSKMNNVNNVSLSLLQMQVDSIKGLGIVLPYSYNDTVIRITPPFPLNINDTIEITVYYHGLPKKDPSGWGGFYFSGTYAFNLGAGFDSDPHVLGRVWFPCIDEFADKSLYDFHITTAAAYKAFCNGLLVSQTNNANGTITWNWKINQPIPTYLAGIAVSTYHTMNRTSNNLPVTWASAVSDTNNILSTFQNLDTILSSYITAYGNYPFEKVGFVLVPFNQGAMEHASSIHIGQPFVNGSLTYETLWAHELSHMWWGDKVTCISEEHMWLNEGFASFNEYFMTEKVYGSQAYKNRMRTNHRKVLQFSHITDGNYLALDNIPHDYTYGTTVYDKSPLVIHTLRNMLGDNDFFSACKFYMNNRAYSNASSNDLRDDFTIASGTNLNRFFEDWIETPGFPHFSIDSVVYWPGGLDHYFVYVRQRSKGNNHIYSIPAEFNFTDGINDTTITVQIDSATQMFHFAIYQLAHMISIDRDEKISDAITAHENWITSTGAIPFPETNVVVNTLNAGIDSSLVRIEHNWVAPDGWKQPNPGIRLSDYHYWKVDGIMQNGYQSQATFSYNGTNNMTTGHIDNLLITSSEDSLVMLYRSSVAEDWSLVNGYTIITGANHSDKIGSIRIDTLKKGEYVFGIFDQTVVAVIHSENNFELKVFPNPSSDTFNITYKLPEVNKAVLLITDEAGRSIEKHKLTNKDGQLLWNASKRKPGIYIVNLIIDNKPTKQLKLVLSK